MPRKKLRITVAYPTDATLNESPLVYPRVMPALGLLSKEFDVEIVGRIPEKMFRSLYKMDIRYRELFQSPSFDKKPSPKDIEEAEAFLGTPLNYLIFSNQRRWGWLNKKGLKEKVARYVPAWKEILKDTDILISFVENLFFTNTAELTAQRMGIKIIKVSRSEILRGGLIFWDIDCNPIFYKKAFSGEFLQKLRERTIAKGETVKAGSESDIRLSNLMKKMPAIPGKIKTLTSGRESLLDADIPQTSSKYARLLSVNLRYLVYPGIHRTFLEKPVEGEKFFLYPLHYEWEAQIASREPFLDQLGLAKQIASSLPSGTFLYVKAHPHWKNADQGISAVRELKKEKNIRIIRPEANTIQLIKNSLGVIVINSTVGYEALVLGKPVIVIGHEIYRTVGIDIKDMNELPRALMSVKSGEYKVDSKKYEQFLKKYTGHFILTDEPAKIAEELAEAARWLCR